MASTEETQLAGATDLISLAGLADVMASTEEMRPNSATQVTAVIDPIGLIDLAGPMDVVEMTGAMPLVGVMTSISGTYSISLAGLMDVVDSTEAIPLVGVMTSISMMALINLRDARGRRNEVVQDASEQRYATDRSDRKNGAERRVRPDTSQLNLSYYTEGRFPKIQPRLLEQASRGHGPLTEIRYSAAASMFIYGKNSVKAALRAGRRKLYKLYMLRDKRRDMTHDETIIHEMAIGRGIEIANVQEVKRGMMDKMSGGRPHNGIVLEASPLPQKPLLSLGDIEDSDKRLGFYVKLDHQSREDAEINGTENFIPRLTGISPKPFVVLLNHVVDPGNLGALVRSAHYLGVDAIVLTDTHSASLDSCALKASAGAAEEMTLFSVSSAADFIEQSKQHGWLSYAAVAPPSRSMLAKGADPPISMQEVEQADPLISHPCILVLGNEGQGIEPDIKAAVHQQVTVPSWRPSRSVDSLNVSVAGALLCQSFLRASQASESMVQAAAKRWSQGRTKREQPPPRPEAPLPAEAGDFGCIF
ncbi:alpha/beta knot [Ophiocordyceps camponoti-floridani]|uniref:rRNA methyltransferase 1, mitochondrial n=1 Tax=Ophiocordyceps camponoti-floridani TaxID=2030778 RepID=A0A8H4VC46_9HYPO|nr:alpha/beta knot [Ophiocordyceps camponoti-floridani]